MPHRLLVLTLLGVLHGVWSLPTWASTTESARDNGLPTWIWSEGSRQGLGAVLLTRQIALDGQVARVRLRVRGEYCDVRAWVNGTWSGDYRAYGDDLVTDVTALLARSTNEIALECRGYPGPSAVAGALEIEWSDGTRTVVTTDETWRARSVEKDRPWDQTPPDPGRSADDVSTLGGIPRHLWPIERVRIGPLDNYEQWRQALENGGADESSATRLDILPGFEVELLRRAGPDEGSWISMAFDSEGRLTIGRESHGFVRLTWEHERDREPNVEIIPDERLQECRGLVYNGPQLFANANNSKSLFAIDTRESDPGDWMLHRVLESTGNVGHGRNDLQLGPDDLLHTIHGDAVDLPTGVVDRTSPLREHRRGERSREGHWLAIGHDGEGVELLAAGMRNPFGLAANEDGEWFTYDADAEFDMGSSWYRPTRVLHLVSGADYGWRGVTGSWPPYFPDQVEFTPSVLDIGKGSPTAVEFGYASRFPPHLRKALFILDWAYGRILAIHMTPRGSSYRCQAELFLQGRPLNVTDLTFGPDGCLYFVTGGRGTQSALYRVRYTGEQEEEEAPPRQQTARETHAAAARHLRRRLESLHAPLGEAAVRGAWPYLDHPDPWIRHAARVAIEHQDVRSWREASLAENDPLAGLTSLLALARTLGADESSERTAHHLWNRLAFWDPSHLEVREQEIFLRVATLCLDHLPAEVDRDGMQRTVEALYPSRHPRVERDALLLLARFGSEHAVTHGVDQLHQVSEPRDRFHILFALRSVPAGWTVERRRTYFEGLGEASLYQGGEGFPGFLERIRSEALEQLREDAPELVERAERWSLPGYDSSTEEPGEREFVRQWTLEAWDATKTTREPDPERGRRMFQAARCDQCHRCGNLGTSSGPDLTWVGRRFSRRDMLQSILLPSRVVAEPYRLSQVEMDDGRVLTGRVVPSTDYRSTDLWFAVDPADLTDVVRLPKAEIRMMRTVAESPMPSGLLDTLTADEIADLLAFLQSSGTR